MNESVHALPENIELMTETELASSLLSFVTAQLADIVRQNTGTDPGVLAAERSFRDLGLDSLGAVELHGRLMLATAMTLPVTIMFEQPSPAALSAHLVTMIRGTEQRPEAVLPRSVPDMEPVAIVGMSCRYPGGIHSPEDLWDVVAGERDVIGPFPASRGWDLDAIVAADPDRRSKTSLDRGGFVQDAAEFDAEFFGISPREALSMDPQQRLLLEVSWEVLERAGIDPASVHGTRTGVFVGAEPQEYGPRLHEAPAGMQAHLLTGSTTSMMSGRIAYSLGLHGPAVTVDTACSSSLVAIHLAAHALQRGECTLAMAGGVAVMAAPGTFIAFSRLRGLSADGRCKAFAATADGTGWSEGVGMLVLERLSDAVRNGHQVLALIRGSAINSDGASNGLTAPNGLAQQAVIRQALANAELRAGEVDAVEAHGTGTALGDPVEARALIATYGERPAALPLHLGSIKSNIGHTQAAAGVAGVIKMVLAMRHGVLPRSLHIDVPTPHVDWSAGTVSLLTEAIGWPAADHPRRAAVSSFGISGTNAHLILEEAVSSPGSPVQEPARPSGSRGPAETVPWLVSGRSEAALAAQAGRLVSHLAARPDLRPADVAFSLAVTRAALERRAVILAGDGADGTATLVGLSRGEQAPGLIRGTAGDGGKLAFLFTGQGSQRLAMGAELHAAFPVFADAFDEACAYLDNDRAGPRLRDVISGDPELLDQTSYTQPALFAVETALYRLAESWGMRPDYLAGHSVGELAAAHVAGVLSLPDACALVTARGALMQELAGGAMVAVAATEEEIAPLLADHEDEVSVASVNGPTALVLSGVTGAVLAIADQWRARGRKTSRLRVSHAFHSPGMDPMLTEFRWVAEAVSYSAPLIPVISNLSGAVADAAQLCSPGYWVNHARQPVRFADSVRWLSEHGVRTFLELGPDGVLSSMVRDCLPDAGEEILAVPVLRRNKPEARELMTAVAAAYVRGARVDWPEFFAGTGARPVELPTYAFQRQSYWLNPARPGGVAELGLGVPAHPLLDAIVTLAGDDRLVLTGRLSRHTQPWLADHVVAGQVLIPGTAFIELAIRAGDEVGCPAVRDLVLETPLMLPERGVSIQLSVGAPDQAGTRPIVFYSRSPQAEADEPWTRHASGAVVPAGALAGAAGELAQWPPAGAAEQDLADFYPALAGAGLAYGPVFRGVRAAWRRGAEIFAEVALPEGTDVAGFALHPALLDAALHLIDASGPGVAVPFEWTDVVVHATGAARLRVKIAPAVTGQGMSLTLADPAGALVAAVGSVVLRALPERQPDEAVRWLRDALFAVDWTPVRAEPGVAAAPLAVLGPDAGLVVPGAARYPSLADLAAAITGGEPVPELVVACCAPQQQPGEAPVTEPAADPARSARQVTARTLALLQSWLAEPSLAASRLMVVTRRAVDAGPDAGLDVAGAPVTGLVRSAAAEHPGRFLLADIDELAGAGELLIAAAALGEPETAIRAGRLLVPRLTRAGSAVQADRPAPGTDGTAPGTDGTVLITGAPGALGALVARHLAATRGAGRMLLISRRGPAAPGAAALAAELAGLGTQVRLASCDVADRDKLGAIIAGVAAAEPLSGVVHAAGVLDDTVIGSLTEARLAAVLRPKADGAWQLHELTKNLGLAAFILFSSAAGILGSPGQGNYAAASTFLDALAAYRRRLGLAATSLAWGTWQHAAGMAGQLTEADLRRMAREGFGTLTDQDGLALLDAAATSDAALLVPARLEPAGLSLSGPDLPPLLSALVRPVRRAISQQHGGAASQGGLAARLMVLSAGERDVVVREVVLSQAALVLGMSGAAGIDPGRAFRDLGFDSLMGVELRNGLAAVTGLRLPATLVFDYPAPGVLAGFVLGELMGGAAGRGPGAVLSRPAGGGGGDRVVVVGAGCRFPGGVGSAEELWELVAGGVDATGGFPADRGWDEGVYDPAGAEGRSYTRRGGFLYGAADFDAGFFGISPREAAAMDPQQRLLLEVCWEALEDAGIDPAGVRGTPAGVFAGVMYHDYAAGAGLGGAGDAAAFLGTGTSGGVLSGRVSYTFGLEGPAVTVDTACSSSLVAVHLAGQALRAGDCDLALAGGVTVMATPETFIDFSRQQGLSRDGRCKAYADTADGTGWAEGAALLVLERESDARRHGHQVLAVIAGSAVNQDGASNGLTAPNGPSQQRVIRAALANAGLRAREVDVVEGHGTGTRLGDPIEVQAVLATYGQDRDPARPVLLGSVKSNIGHTQAAAGAAGIIKMITAMAHATVPASLHIGVPTAQVDWAAGAVALVTGPVPWPAAAGRPRRAGVSSFGFSGTNAHVILEQGPVPPGRGLSPARRPGGTGPGGPLSWVISGRTGRALRAQAARLRDWVAARPGLDLADAGWSLAATRSVLEHRAVITGTGRDALLAGLAGVAAGNPGAGVVTGAAGNGGRTGFVFTGQGAQRPGMGQELAAAFPVFAAAFGQVCAELDTHLDTYPGGPGARVAEVVSGGGGLDQTVWAQAALFAVQVAQFRLLESWGLVPDVVAGHSIGEVTAAYLAGVWSLPDACAVVAARGTLMQALAPGGAMLAAAAGETRVRDVLARYPGAGVAAVNGPRAVVISGTRDAVAGAGADLARTGVRTRALRVSHAFHSALMDPMLDQFAQAISSVSYRQPRIPLISALTGTPVTAEVTDPGYWVRHVRETVRFADAVTALRDAGVRTFIEVGPDAALTATAAADTAGGADTPDEAWLPLSRRGRGETGTLLSAVGAAFVRGVPVNWAQAFAGTGAGPGARVKLPSYAFQRQRYWLDAGTTHPAVTRLGQAPAGHPLLSAAIDLPATGAMVLTGRLSLAGQPWLADHVVAGRVLLPGTAMVEMAIRAGDQAGCGQLDELVIQAPLPLPDHGAIWIQVMLDAAAESGRRAVSIYARAEDNAAGQQWTRHAAGMVGPAGPAAPDAGLAQWPPPGAVAHDLAGFYPALAQAGLEYGPVWRGVRRAWRRGDEVFAEVELPEDTHVSGFAVHPALLDAALHVIGLGTADPEPVLPFAWMNMTVHASGASAGRVRIAPSGDQNFSGDQGVSVTLTDATGEPLISVGSLTLRPLPRGEPGSGQPATANALFRVDWVPARVPATGERLARLAVLGEDKGLELPSAMRYAGVAELAEAVAAGGQEPDLVFVPCLTGTRDAGAGLADAGLAARDVAARALGLMQEWLARDEPGAARLVLVTQGAVDAGPGVPVNVAVAPVWGLVRSAMAEYPGRLLLVDVDVLAGVEELVVAGAALAEPEFAVRGAELRVPRLARAGGGLRLPGRDGWRLVISQQGSIDGLGVGAAADAGRPLTAGEVRVGVRAAGMNFRDVLNVLGMYPGDAGLPGLEGAGFVLETGPGVAGLAAGNAVMGLFSGGFGPVAVTDARLLTRLPAGWSLAEAAGVPVVFLTAYHALVNLARVAVGQTVLIHAAAGGVGMAAVQLARHLGARVLGTASPGKWAALRDLGLAEGDVASSRTVEFEEMFRAVTGGRGVDVVLDSLAGEFVDASLRLTAVGGRFIEMGKTDLRDPAQVMAAHGVGYQAFDLNELEPDQISAMLGVLSALFADGTLRPLPTACWDVRRAKDAFRYLAQARNIGKVVLTIPAPPPVDGTVLITGAPGALGGLAARHLAASGRVYGQVLVSRRGPTAPGAAVLAADLAGLGADVQLTACDAGDRAGLAQVIAAIAAAVPLRGVLHAAGVLDDAVIGSLTPARLDAVLRAKAGGAWYLHELTKDLDLAGFTLFSSIAGVTGSAGQGSYAAANTFLDALAAHRRRDGLPAVSLAWGAWEQPAGMAGRLGAVDRRRLARDGFGLIGDEAGLALLDAGGLAGEALLVAVPLDLAWLRARGDDLPPLLSHLIARPRRDAAVRGAASRTDTDLASGLAARLAGLPLGEQESVVCEVVLGQVAVVLGMAGAGEVEVGRSFRELGFDSLTAVELRNRLGAVTGLRLPATVVFDYPAPGVLAGFVRARLVGAGGGEPVPGGAGVVPGQVRVVIVGMGCRFPGGVGSAGDLWELVAGGRDAVGGFPVDRGWDLEGLFDPDPDRAGTSYCRAGGFVEGAAEFDAGFFGISPREAVAMDPQQRLLLEVCWEALEDAGIGPASLRGTPAGVFTGLIYHDYAQAGEIPGGAEGYLGTGGSGGVASGRVSYVLGLEGPAVTVDTACSSSLVAVHLAGQALRSGECDLALAGGVTVMATPGTFVDFSRQRGLARDGRCKAYADAADGTGWGEGAGVLVLEREPDAVRRGHRILAVVAGSAVNQDGASHGLTAPNGPSQQRVIRAALASAGLRAREVDVVEGHGTGTRLGDPIEAQALLASYGQDRGDARPLWLGSVKSNIGHTQAAAGVAGIIKMVTAMRHAVIPATLHAGTPTRQVDWASGAVRLATGPVPWPAVPGRPRRAGVSSFGFSGTNAHLILEQGPVPPRAGSGERDRSRGPVSWVISGRSGRGLRAQAARLRDWVAARPELDPADVGWSLAAGRSALEHRAVVTGAGREELLAGLGAVAAGEPAAGVSTGTAGGTGRVVFVFPGQGGQWPGMGQELAAFSPAFAARLGECARALAPYADWPGGDVLAGAARAGLDRAEVVQPALWAVMVSLAAAWQAAGVTPDAVAGHSQGEIAAATVAGILTLQDAARIVALRARALGGLSGQGGGMLSVSAAAAEVRERLAGWDGVSVAAVNGPASTVVSGDADMLGRFAAACAAAGVRTRPVQVGYASHCARVEGVREQILADLDGISPRPPRITMISAMTGEPLDQSRAGTGYWYDSLRAPVEFDQVIRTLAAAGHRAFIEVSPHPVLAASVTATLEDAGVRTPAVTGTLRRADGGAGRFLTSLAQAYVRGAGVDWTAVLPQGQRVDLPSYAFQRDRYWPRPAAPAAAGITAAGLDTTGHPLLGAALTLAAGDGYVCTGRLSLTAQPWLGDHAVNGTVLLPGTAFVELAIRAGDQAGCGDIGELTLHAPLILTPAAGVQVQVRVSGPGPDGRRAVEIHARAGTAQQWARHASGHLTPPPGTSVAGTSVAGAGGFAVWPPPGAVPADVAGLYGQLAAAGYGYGPVFRGVRAAWRRGDDVFAEVELGGEEQGGAFCLHPGLLDAALHAAALLGAGDQPGHARLPFAWTGVSLHAAGATRLRVRLTGLGGGALSLAAADQGGAPVLTVSSLAFRPAPDRFGAAAPDDALFAERWIPVTAGGNPELEMTLVRAGRGAPGAGTAAQVLGLVQRWLAEEHGPSSRLVIATCGAVAVRPGEVVTDLAGAAVRGLVRSAQSEYPGRLVLADVQAGDAEGVGVLAGVLASGEPELAVRAGTVYARRLGYPAGGLLVRPGGGGPWRLEVTGRGTLDGFALVPYPEAGAPLTAGQVRVGVRAAGMNFRDVLIGLDMYPGAAVMGGEVAGVVLETGPGVAGLAAGDRVLGLTAGGFGPVTVTDAQLLVPVPAGWSFADAAAVPVAYLTAWHALAGLAGARAGQKLLVHAAAGGVGMAAVAVARYLGLEVYGTASPAKHPVLAGLGLDQAHIASSRSAGFAEKFPAVDIVLNALAGELADASLRLLPGGGVFIEMGKTALRDPARVAQACPGVSYQVLDLTRLGPGQAGPMLAQVTALLAGGALPRLPVRAWDVRRAGEAFRFMSQARHTGKLVLTIPPDPSAPRPRGAVLVTGGTGTLGALAAGHIAAGRCALPAPRTMVLASRSGPGAAGAARLAAALAGAGQRVRVACCDAADRDALAGLLATAGADDPLTAVVHAAGILDDAMIATLTGERVTAVMRPKAGAARNLDELTADADLAAFVMFSSAAAAFGSAGQGNYTAANAYLDALASSRQARGLPALSLAWGLWEQASGMTARLSGKDRARLTRGAMSALTAQDGLALLDLALARDEAVLIPVRLDIAALRAQDTAPALLRDLAGPPARPPAPAAAAAAAGAGDGLRSQLAALPAAGRAALLTGLVRAHAAAVLGHAAADAVEAGRPFAAAGFDSLTAVELRNRLNTATGLRLPATAVFDYPTPQALARHLHTALLGGDPGPGAAGADRAGGGHAGDREPVAVVAMSCRFPGGVSTPEQLWELVAGGGDAITGFPADRGWDLDALFDPDPAHEGTAYVREGGFLHAAGDFDPGFFGISPREALAMDPQQRLLLETSWETFERAGIDPALLRGTPAGVFIGAAASGYGASQPGGLEGYLVAGTAPSVIPGRVAYTFGLEGPAVLVDTACSSSLVALHLAAQALRAGECSLALAGGVTVMATPAGFTGFSRQRGLAPDGRCKPFAAAADGMGMSEGAGILLLERLSDAVTHGHPVLAVLAGSAVNQDGASNGLTAPNGPSQQRVIRAALTAAALGPADIDAVEAHGTGTPLGDPIEAHALLAAYGQDRPPGRPLWLGSVKSNIGHTQWAAGAAGVMKTILALQHCQLPPTLHAAAPSPHIDWTPGTIQLLTAPVPWPPSQDRPRRAGISSFGISGTNAHLILEEPPAPQAPAPQGPAQQAPAPQGPAPQAPAPQAPAPRGAAPRGAAPRGPVPWIVSGRGEAGLRAQAARLRDWAAARPGLDLDAAGVALATSRARLDRRAVITAADRGELLAGLAAVAAGQDTAAVVTGTAGQAGKIGFVFTGQGSQRPGMGLGLYAAYPVFAAAFDQVCAGLDRHLGGSVAAVIRDGTSPDGTTLDDTVHAQAALFAVQVALVRLLSSWGITPDIVAGHSTGELAAAHVAGVWSLPDACAVVAARGQLMQALPPGGAMTAVEAGEDQVLAVLAHHPGAAIAAVNGPDATVISGEQDAVHTAAAALAAAGTQTRELRVSHAFHSPLMDPMLARFAAVTRSVASQAPAITLVSALTGTTASDELTDPRYWVRHVREPVRFADAVTTLRAAGTRTFIEIGPAAILTALGPRTTPHPPPGETWLPALRHGHDETHTLLRTTATAHTRGIPANWTPILTPTPADPPTYAFQPADPPTYAFQPADLPTYAFQHQRYWLTSRTSPADATGLGQCAAGHPLLGAAVELPATGGMVLTGRLSLAAQPWLAEHVIAGQVLLPGTAIADMAVRAANQTGCQRLTELLIETPLLVPVRGAVQVQVTVAAADETGRRPASVFSRAEGAAAAEPWTRHATALLTGGQAAAGLEQWPAEQQWPPAGATPVDLAGFYPAMAEAGMRYGPVFQGLRQAWRRGEEVFAEVALPEGTPVAGYGMHPALLDAALHVIALGPADAEQAGPLVPFAWADVQLPPAGATWARVRVAPSVAEDGMSVQLADGTGKLLASVGSVVLRPLPDTGPGHAPAPRDLYRLDWRAAGLAGPAAGAAGWVVLGADDCLAIPDASRYGDLAALAAAVAAGQPGPDVVVSRCLAGQPGGQNSAQLARRMAAHVLRLIQAWLAEPALAQSRLLLLTRLAVDAGSAREVPVDLTLAPVWGLVRAAIAENPGRFLLADVDVEADAGPLVVAGVRLGEPEFAIRAGQLLVPRLVRVAASAAGQPSALDPAGTVLITGAPGALGALVARHLVTGRGARKLVLLSRRGPATGAGIAAELAGLGAEVRLAACDVGDQDALAAVMAAIPGHSPLCAVVHTAGVLDDALIGSLRPDGVDTVMRPKADGAWHLHQLTRDLDLAMFVLFSSVAGILGGAGQGNYAAANTFLDALAAYRRKLGLAGVSLAWGAWAQAAGMAGRAGAASRRRLAGAGLADLDDATGLALLDAAVATEDALLVPAQLDVARLGRTGATVPPMLSGLLPQGPARRAGDPGTANLAGPDAAGGPGALAARLAGLDEAEQDSVVRQITLTQTALVLGMPGPDAIDASRPFRDLGFDSLAAVELRNQLVMSCGVQLPATVLFSYPTPAALAAYLRSRTVPAQTGQLPVLDALDKLEAAVAQLAGGSEKRDEITARLAALAAAIGAHPGDSVPAGSMLDAVTDDQMFELIDQELGVS